MIGTTDILQLSQAHSKPSYLLVQVFKLAP